MMISRWLSKLDPRLRGGDGAVIASLALLAVGCVAPQPPAPPASAATVAAARGLASSQAEWTTACQEWDEWDKTGPAWRVHGDTYYVGTCGITALLVASPQGHVLFDSGTREGAVRVLENVRLLGFRPENIGTVLTSHEHFDHVGGLWWIHQNSGARVLTSPQAQRVIGTGEADPGDPQFGMYGPMHPLPAGTVSTIQPGRPVALNGLSFTPIATPGHTPGALSWQWESCEGGECLSIVYADSLSPISSDEYRFSDHPAYVAEYRAGLDRLAALDCDILLTPHPSASKMHERLVAGTLRGGMSCRDYAAGIAARLDERLAKEAAQ